MAGTDDISFIELDNDTLEKFREIAREKLSRKSSQIL
jgi:hypothetical protein